MPVKGPAGETTTRRRGSEITVQGGSLGHKKGHVLEENAWGIEIEKEFIAFVRWRIGPETALSREGRCR